MSETIPLSFTIPDPITLNLAPAIPVNISTPYDDTAINARVDFVELTKVDKIDGKGLSTEDFTTEYSVKLDGISEQATKNLPDAQLLSRENHTGVQAQSTVSGLTDSLFAKVDKVQGKYLSTEDYTSDEKAKLASLSNYDPTEITNRVSAVESGKVDKNGSKVLSDTNYTKSEKDKLSGIAPLATANDSNANLRDRSTHTGVQSQATITGLTESLAAKQSTESGKGLSSNNYTSLEKTKLANIATNATANSTDEYLLSRSNHTGTQLIATVSGLQAALDAKQVAIAGKGLSTNDYTDADKTKLAGLSNSGPNGALVLTGPYTFTDADHKKLVLVDSANTTTLTFPQTLTDGFSITAWQIGVGQIVFEIAGRVVRSNASRISTAYAGDTVNVTVTSSSVVATEFATPLTTQYQSNSAALSYTSSTAASWATTFPALVLEAGGVYEIDYRVIFQTDNTAASVKLSFPNNTGLSNVQLDYKVQQAAPGTAAFRIGSLSANTSMNAAGTASVASTPLLGHLTGRVTVGANTLTLVPQLSGIGATGTVSVAIGAATIMVRKVYGAPMVSVAYGLERVMGLDTSAWTKTSGVTVSGTKITAVNGGNMIFREGVLTAGKTYKVELDMTFTSGAEVRLITTSPGSDETGRIRWTVVNGHLTGTFVATGTWLGLEARNATFSGTIDNWTVKEVL